MPAQLNSSPILTSIHDAKMQQAEQQLNFQELSREIFAESKAAAEASTVRPQVITPQGDTVNSLLQKSLADLQAQQEAQRVKESLDWDRLSVEIGQDIRTLHDRRKQLAAKIAEDSSVSLFDHPLDALVNAFTLPWDQQALNSVNQQLEIAAKTSQAANNHLQQSAISADKTKQALTDATVRDVAAAAEGLAISQAADARIKALQTQANMVESSIRMSNHQVDLSLKEAAYKQSVEQMEMAREREARQMEILNLQLRKEKSFEEAEAQANNYAAAALLRLGKNPQKINLKLLRNQSAKYFDELVQQGIKLAINGEADYSPADTISERMRILGSVGWEYKTPQQETVIAMQHDAVQTTSAGGVKDKEGKVVSAESLFTEEFKKKQQDIGEGSPFRAPAWKVIADVPEIMNHPIWRDYIHTPEMARDSSAPVSEQLVYEAAVKAVWDRKVSVTQAAELIKSVFQRAVHINNATHQFKMLTGGLEQTEYKSRINTGGFGGRLLVNHLDAVQVQSAIVSILAHQLGVLSPILKLGQPEMVK